MFRFQGLEQFVRSQARYVLLAGMAAALVGCMRVPRAPLTPPHWMGSPTAPAGDPFLNSQPQVVQPRLSEPTPVPFPEDGPQPTFNDGYSAPMPVESFRFSPTPVELPAESQGFANPNVEPPLLEGPTIVPQGVTLATALGLSIKAPENNLVGEVSVFEITLQNTGDQPAKEVMIESRFEDGFVFPGSKDRQVTQTIGTLNPGDSRDVKLSLKSDRAGYHCVEFFLLAQGMKPVTKKVCVEYQDAAVSLEVNGPVKRMVGGNAEWNLTVLSRDFLPITNASVTLDYDSTYLKPVGGSEGAKQELGRITWPLGMLQVSERVELQVEFQCLMPVDSTCLSFKVSADGDLEQTSESCLAIDRRLGALDIDLQDAADPVKLGEETEYLITITNRELHSVHDLQITATLPGLFKAISTEVREGRQLLPAVRAKVEGSLIRFDSVDVLAPDAQLTYRIKVQAQKAGTDRFLLSVSSDDAASGKIRLEEVSTVVQ
jgi:hypothetical protein